MTKCFKVGPKISIELDTNNDATPVMVYGQGQEYSATFDCAIGTGLLSGSDGDIELNEKQLAWLASMEDIADETYNAARKDSPDYRD